jgi:arginine deiminase
MCPTPILIKLTGDSPLDASWDAIEIKVNELTLGREGGIHCMTMNVRTK